MNMFHQRLLILIIMASSFLGLGSTSYAVKAEPPTPSRSLYLIGAVPEGSLLKAPKGVYTATTQTMLYVGGEVRLTSSPDGQGAIRTDDMVSLQVQHPDGHVVVWSHDFRSSAGAVESMEAPDITALFAQGINTLTLRLHDLLPPTFSTSPYFLVMALPANKSAASGNPTGSTSPASTPTIIPIKKTPAIDQPVPVPATPQVLLTKPAQTKTIPNNNDVSLLAFCVASLVVLIMIVLILLSLRKVRHNTVNVPTLEWLTIRDLQTRRVLVQNVVIRQYLAPRKIQLHPYRLATDHNAVVNEPTLIIRFHARQYEATLIDSSNTGLKQASLKHNSSVTLGNRWLLEI